MMEAKEETAIDMAKKQLDALGIKYEMSGNKFKPFKVIYKPYNEDLDALYDQEYELTRIYQNDKGKENWEKLSQIREKGKRLEEFEDIIDLFNLGSAVKSSMGEAKFMSGMLSGKDFINAKLKNYPKAKAKVNQLINMIGESKFTIEMAEWIFDFFNNAHFESPINEAKISHFKIGDVVELKTIPENLPYEIRKGIIDNKWEIIRVSKSGRSMHSDIMEDVFGYDIELLDKKLKYKMFVYPEDVKQSMNEAKEEDIVDTITMDVPLFIRMLEYSREDAAEDMDLHDVTEKAISLGKERGILQMDDYDEIIGSAEEMNEASSFAQQAAIAISKKKSGNYDKEGKRIKETSDPQSGKAAPYGSGYKPLEERISEALDSINEELCPAGKAYRKRRMAAGEKSSAYLSGRAVKVCKGQMSGKKKK